MKMHDVASYKISWLAVQLQGSKVAQVPRWDERVSVGDNVCFTGSFPYVHSLGFYYYRSLNRCMFGNAGKDYDVMDSFARYICTCRSSPHCNQ